MVLAIFVVVFVLGDSPVSEFCVSTFRDTLFHIHGSCLVHTTYEYGTVFRNVGT